jgi:hypothetical protein
MRSKPVAWLDHVGIATPRLVRCSGGTASRRLTGARTRHVDRRLDGLLDEPRPGTPRKISDDEIADTVRRALKTTPHGATHWSLRSMPKAVGYAPSTIHRMWRALGLQPHRTQTFKLSNDPLFVDRHFADRPQRQKFCVCCAIPCMQECMAALAERIDQLGGKQDSNPRAWQLVRHLSIPTVRPWST